MVKAQPAASFQDWAVPVATVGTEKHKLQQPNALLNPIGFLLSCSELSSPREEQFNI